MRRGHLAFEVACVVLIALAVTLITTSPVAISGLAIVAWCLGRLSAMIDEIKARDAEGEKSEL